MLRFTFTFTEKSINNTLIRMALHFIDKAAEVRISKPAKQRIDKIRSKAEEEKRKKAYQETQERAQKLKADKKKAKNEEDALLDPDI